MAGKSSLPERLVIVWYVLIWLVLVAAVIYAFARGHSLGSPPSVISLAIFIIFSILAVRTRTRLFACLSLTTIGVPLYLFEAYLWFTITPPPSKAEHVAKLRKQGIAAYPAVFPSGFLQLWQGAGGNAESPIVIGAREVLPLAGIPDVVTVLCRNADLGWVTYRSDSLGFRTQTIEGQSAAPEFALLGDSFVHGCCVSGTFTYAQQLSALGRTFSYGMNGTSALVQLAIFREYVRPIRPYHIVWFFYEGNDLAEYLSERAWPQLRAYLERSYLQGLVDLTGPIALAMRRFVDQRFEGIEVATVGHDWPRLAQSQRISREMVDFLLLRRARAVSGLVVEPALLELTEAEWHEITAIWREVIDTQRTQGGRITFVYIPAHSRFLSKGPTPFQALEQKVLTLWSDLSADYISLTAVLEGARNPLRYYADNDLIHFNEEGYRLTAKAIIKHLRHSPDG